jgi:hypothetical protein
VVIKDDKPQDAEQATLVERKVILDKLSEYVNPDRVLNIDGEKRRGTFTTKTPDSGELK